MLSVPLQNHITSAYTGIYTYTKHAFYPGRNGVRLPSPAEPPGMSKSRDRFRDVARPFFGGLGLGLEGSGLGLDFSGLSLKGIVSLVAGNASIF